MKTFAVCMLLALCGGVSKAATPDGDPPANRAATTTAAKAADSNKSDAPGKANAGGEVDLHQLQNLVESQSEEIEALKNRLAALEAERSASKVTPEASSSPAGGIPAASAPVASEVSAGSVNAPAATATAQVASGGKESTSPLSVRIGSAEFTPGGFLDFAAFYRTTNVGSGIATSFGAIPYNNQLPQGRLSETRFSAQYSRLSLKVDAPLPKSTSLTAYVESDFLGFQPANAYQTANSDSLRLRVFWANVRRGNWEVLGGQEWSLMTPNRVGLSPYTSDVFYTLVEDPDFHVGLIWARQPQFRVVYHLRENLALGVSLENPQQFAPASVVYPSTFFTSQFDNGSGSTSAASSATNTAVPNLHPDIVVKTAYDARPAGHALHAEAAGLIRSFRVLNDLKTPPVTNTITGGGGSINLNYELIHNLRLIGNSFYSDGGGRYIFGLGPDAIVKPNGALSAVHSGAGLTGFEYQATEKNMFYAYYGGAYFERNYGFLPAAATSSCNGSPSFTCVGFGFPGSANTSNRAVQEATIGYIPTLWSHESYGRFQIITQYSYVVRSPWSIPVTAGPNPKNAHMSMVYLDFRYTLP